jgi:hypothetical protein
MPSELTTAAFCSHCHCCCQGRSKCIMGAAWLCWSAARGTSTFTSAAFVPSLALACCYHCSKAVASSSFSHSASRAISLSLSSSFFGAKQASAPFCLMAATTDANINVRAAADDDNNNDNVVPSCGYLVNTTTTKKINCQGNNKNRSWM